MIIVQHEITKVECVCSWVGEEKLAFTNEFATFGVLKIKRDEEYRVYLGNRRGRSTDGPTENRPREPGEGVQDEDEQNLFVS